MSSFNANRHLLLQPMLSDAELLRIWCFIQVSKIRFFSTLDRTHSSYHLKKLMSHLTQVIFARSIETMKKFAPGRLHWQIPDWWSSRRPRGVHNYRVRHLTLLSYNWYKEVFLHTTCSSFTAQYMRLLQIFIDAYDIVAKVLVHVICLHKASPCWMSRNSPQAQ